MNNKFDFKSVYKHTAKEFEKDMKNVITFWKSEETKFYNNTKQTFLNLKSGDYLVHMMAKQLFDWGQAYFPLQLHHFWVALGKGFVNIDDSSYAHYSGSDFVQLVQQNLANRNIVLTDSNARFYNMTSGHTFEEIMIELYKADNSVIKQICELLFGSVDFTGHKKLREDAALTKEYTLDFKYSTKVTEIAGKKFKSLVKEYGSEEYKSIVDIEDSIIRSLYTFGASEGRDEGGPGNYGIWKSSEDPINGRQFEELKGKKYRGSKKYIGNQAVPSGRKTLIFMFPENGYWASYCLEEITKWASNRIVEMEFINQPTNLHQSLASLESVDYKQFWL